ncbi:MAG TPA: hypothetical protein ENJ00_06770 [Phycisphaerales bacterium]|nr:hypothetical protein [Phycisphaerales bacterium]
MSSEQSVRVNFGKPMPIFPLNTAVLMPQQVIPLHIFEPRYTQMVGDALDSVGQIAIAIFEGDAWKSNYQGRPPVRPAVCIGQIVQHELRPGGTYDILIQGVCRARIRRELPPETDILYRRVMLEPTEDFKPDEQQLEPVRDWIAGELSSGELARFETADDLLGYIRDERIPTSALLELISFTILDDSELKYSLLEEPNPAARAGLIQNELQRTTRLLRLTHHQHPESWPKGCSWN